MAAEAAKQRIRERSKREQDKLNSGIEWILKNEPDALHANNL